MIIFGLRSGTFKAVAAPVGYCNYCQSHATVQFYFSKRYFHIFWVPVFPIGTTGISECTHCKRSLRREQMGPAAQNGYGEARRELKTSPKYFAGLILVALFVGAAAIAGFVDFSNSKTYIRDPLAGDIYEVKENGIYTLYRVKAVSGDSVHLDAHLYEAPDLKEFRALRRDYSDNYSDERFALSRKQLWAMFDDRRIRSVKRK